MEKWMELFEKTASSPALPHREGADSITKKITEIKNER
jgi:hypothetical protein